MEGTLWKWTNYISGWQPRWFVLDDGVLSYYKSQEDVNNGCKGSIKMSVCDVVVHTTDSSRLDLIIPGEQHFYVKAATPQERQQWLVALGTSKACRTAGRPQMETGEISPDILRTKKSELRLYCDVLMQQVHAVKTSVSTGESPDVEKLSDASCLLGATCDTFIQTLEDCMQLAHAKIVYEVPHQHITDAALPLSPSKSSARKSAKGVVHRSSSSDSFNARQRGESASSYSRQSSRSSVNSDHTHPEAPVSPHGSDKPSLSPISDGELSPSPDCPHIVRENGEDASPPTPNIPTFFNSMPYSFMDLRLQEDGGIPVEPYLHSCSSLVPIFDRLNSTAFSPVKMDFTGNIRKIQQKYSIDPVGFTSLQKIVLYEVSAKQYEMSSSATVAILWMKRSLEFIREFLQEIVMGQENLTAAATNAYTRTLRNYHGWVIRGVFALAVKAIPDRSSFLTNMALNSTDCEEPEFIKLLLGELEDYVTAVDVIVTILQDFYKANNLESEEPV